jgi:hypothetical protein
MGSRYLPVCGVLILRCTRPVARRLHSRMEQPWRDVPLDRETEIRFLRFSEDLLAPIVRQQGVKALPSVTRNEGLVTGASFGRKEEPLRALFRPLREATRS